MVFFLCYAINHVASMTLRAVSFLALLAVAASADYVVDDTNGIGRMFDGIGGLSGGGVS